MITLCIIYLVISAAIGIYTGIKAAKDEKTQLLPCFILGFIVGALLWPFIIIGKSRKKITKLKERAANSISRKRNYV